LISGCAAIGVTIGLLTATGGVAFGVLCPGVTTGAGVWVLLLLLVQPVSIRAIAVEVSVAVSNVFFMIIGAC
jgi:hypothetical protein